MDKTGEAQSSAASIAKAMIQAEPIAKSNTESKAESKTESKTESRTESKTETEAKAKAKADSITNMETLKNELGRYLLLLEYIAAPVAMRLFELWVNTGKLRPMIRHKSNTIGHNVYTVLYVLACGFGHETLGNLLIDELIRFYEETELYPMVSVAQKMYRLLKDFDGPFKKLVLRYLVAHSKELEKELGDTDWMRNSDAELNRDLLLMLTKVVNKSVGAFLPLFSNRCQYHIHRVTQPCKK